MTYVTYDRAKHSIRVKGHAHYAELGNDLVCAASSIICYTAAENMCKLCRDEPEKYQLVRFQFKVGDAELECAARGDDAELTRALDAVCVGFELLSEGFPQNISYDKK